MGLEGTRKNVLIGLLIQIMRQPLFDQLRTKEQLGYIVSIGAQQSNGTLGMRIIVQSNQPPEYLDVRIELFLMKMHDELVQMEPFDFETHRTALATIRSEKPQNISDQADKYWDEIAREGEIGRIRL